MVNSGKFTRRDFGAALSLGLMVTPVPVWGQSTTLYPNESIFEAEGIPILTRAIKGAPNKPLILFFPGGGHFARIAYGHPGSRAADFLLPQLEARGFSTLALSYPTNAPVFPKSYPALTIDHWARAGAVVSSHLADRGIVPRQIIAVGWSLGGRVARDFAKAAENGHLSLDGFIGLSATAPIPGFGNKTIASQVVLDSDGLWESAAPSVLSDRFAMLAAVDRQNGRAIIPHDVYIRDYVCDTPLNLRGEDVQYRDGHVVSDLCQAIADQGSLDFASYPLTAVIAADGQSDGRHTLTDASAWAFLNAQTLYLNMVAPRLAKGAEIAPASWQSLKAIFDGLGARLSRRVEGSHSFFVGERGASQTAEYISSLIAQMDAIRREIAVALQ